jgi:hypothetical protein
MYFQRPGQAEAVGAEQHGQAGCLQHIQGWGVGGIPAHGGFRYRAGIRGIAAQYPRGPARVFLGVQGAAGYLGEQVTPSISVL